MSRILFICPYTPYPVTDGAKLRVYNTAKILAKHHSVDLVVTEKETPSEAVVSHLEEKFESVTIFRHNDWEFYKNIARSAVSRRPAYSHYHVFDDVRAWIDRQPKYDLYYCSYVHMAEYLRHRDEPTVIDLVDAMSRNYLTRASRDDSYFGLKRPFRYVEGKKLLRYERALVSDFDQTFVISPADKEFICRTERNDLSVVPNGVKESYLRYENPDDGSNDGQKSIVFFGKMDYFPNEDAVTHFVREIFPRLTDELPDVQFRIVGADPSEKVRELEAVRNVEVVGFVDESPKHITDADVMVAPMRFGTGVQNKILEAMALGQPVVTTPLGQEGIVSEDGEHLVVAEGDESFAEATRRLLKRPDERRRIGANARRLIEQRYTWSAIESLVTRKVEEAMRK